MKTATFPIACIFLLSFLIIRHPSAAQNWELEYSGLGFYDVFLLEDNQAWAIGDRGYVAYTNDGGESWSHRVTMPLELGLLSVWGTSATEIWAVGFNGYIMKFDGNGWERQFSPVTETLLYIWGTDASNIWAVSTVGNILHYNGDNWTVHTSVGVHISAIWGADAENIWVAGQGGVIYKYDGNIWTQQASGTSNSLIRLHGIDATNVWATGENGTILKYNGTSWEPQSSNSSVSIFGIYAAGADDVWAIAPFDAILHFDGNNWSRHTPIDFWLTNIRGNGPNNIWAVGRSPSRVLRLTGDNWQHRFFAQLVSINAIWGFDESNIWAVGENLSIFRFEGTRWQQEFFRTIDHNLFGVWGSGPNNLWAVGEFGRIMEYNGNSWTEHSTGVWPRLNAIWGADAENVWAVGANGVIIKYDGNSWNLQNMSIFQNYNSVWGSGPNDVWAVGGGNIARYNGTSWTVNPAPPSLAGNLVAVSGTAANDVWMISDVGNVWTFNGSQWTYKGNAGVIFANGLWVKDASNVWVAGLSRISHYNGTTWSVQGLNEQSFMARAIWGTDSKLWATGSNGSIWSNNTSPVQVKEHADNYLSNYVLYPNPTQDLLYVAGRDGDQVFYVLFDAVGRSVLRGTLSTDYISLAGLSPGLYLLNLQNRNGKVVKKVIKH